VIIKEIVLVMGCVRLMKVVYVCMIILTVGFVKRKMIWVFIGLGMNFMVLKRKSRILKFIKMMMKMMKMKMMGLLLILILRRSRKKRLVLS